ncbi:MAG: nicotinate-nucleotide adenylyltransferase [bacterium]
MNRENMPVHDEGGNWGILGGTFDPVHFGHINLAQEIKNIKKLDGVLFIPSINHPCREPVCYASFEERVNMLRAALKNYPEFTISEIESELELSGYTFDTITALKKKYPRASFYFIIGSDNLLQLTTWYKADELLKSVKFLAGTRPGFKFEFPEGLPEDNIEFIKTPVVKISSSYIRKLLKEGSPSETIDKFIPSAVREYIMERKLYQ